jgi:geranylgeranyl transferase type-2 subunit beta
MSQTSPSVDSEQLLRDKHVQFVKSFESINTDSIEYWMTEHLRVNGIYWGLTGVEVMGRLGDLDREKTLSFVRSCLKSGGGFGGNVQHDPHLLYTLSAIQICSAYDVLDTIDWTETIKWIASLQTASGGFMGDQWGEIDTRFSYCAVSSLSLLGKLDVIDCDKAVKFILDCQNFDGSFGVIPEAESHAGQTFTCLGTLAILGAVDYIDRDLVGWWLAERQVKDGGLNGRPEKLADVCYSWWVLSSLAIIDRLHWIDREKLIEWIFSTQDDETGGFADKPGNMPDVYHSCFAITGLSLLGYPNLLPVNPNYCMTHQTINRLKLSPPPVLTLPNPRESKKQ